MKLGLLGAGLLAALLAAPVSAQAQIWLPRLGLNVSPFLGFSFGHTQSSTVEVDFGQSIAPGFLEARTHGAALGGLTVEAPVHSLFAVPAMEGVHLVAAAAYGRRTGGATTIILPGEDEDAPPMVVSEDEGGQGVLVAKFGLGIQVPVALPSVITIAPALVRVIPQHVPNDALDRARAVNYPGLNLGFEVGFPTRLTASQFRVALEDFITYPSPELADRVNRFFAVESGARARTHLPTKPSHLLLVRLGLSVQF